MPLRRPSGDPLIAPESWRRPAWGAPRRPACCRPPRGAAWTAAHAARARVTGRHRRSRGDAQRPWRGPVVAWDVAGWLRARPVRGRGQGPGRGAGTAGEAVAGRWPAGLGDDAQATAMGPHDTLAARRGPRSGGTLPRPQR